MEVRLDQVEIGLGGVLVIEEDLPNDFELPFRDLLK